MKNSNYELKQTIRQFKEELADTFCKTLNITQTTHKLVSFVDETLIDLFQKNKLDISGNFCLVAIGSYGRRELQLYSDIDLLLLHCDNTTNTELNQAQRFIQDCWDAGLQISHQITTVNDCAKLAHQDLSVISSILDIHPICGRNSLMEELQYQTHRLHMWSSQEFFFAKLSEQHKRYEKYNETAYNLEPNVKYGPGGLRDLQFLLCIGKRNFDIKKFSDGIKYGFITDKEYDELIHCLQFLWRIRFALHSIAHKNEERLLFDHQVKLAEIFNYKDNAKALGIEQFMKAYFKVIKRARTLNEILLQWFNETIIHQQKQTITPLDRWFQLSNAHIEAKHSRVFSDRPHAILELFLWIAKHPEIKGIRASTIRLIREHLYLIGKSFRVSSFATKTFIAIFNTANNPYEALHQMSRYEVLGRYLESFAAVTGQMQYDLFHVYTVDQHTLFVIRNLGRFLDNRFKKQFPLCVEIMNNLSSPQDVYLAALFHDIGKGRGGDHSQLGAIDALEFSRTHKLSNDSRQLLIWLVENHLLMSHTAQRHDIYDPKTIDTFCNKLPMPHYLDYLYLLTVADTCATDPNRWNGWKDTLLKELYFAAKKALEQDKPLLDEKTIINLRKSDALHKLKSNGVSESAIEPLWQQFKGLYFLHESAEVIAKHTQAILECKQFPLVMILPHHSMGATEILIYMPHRDERFTITTTVLNNHHITIQEANILTSKNNFDLDTYIILDENNQAFLNEKRIRSIECDLISKLSETSLLPTITRRRISRAQAHFKRSPQISFTTDAKRDQTALFLITEDRPGLLANISRVFLKLKILLINAKIATAGERAEDMFYITNQFNNHLNVEEEDILRNEIIKLIINLSHFKSFP